MRIETREPLSDVVTMEIAGNVDASNAPELEQVFEEIITGGNRRLIVSFKEVGYISSAGLRVFLTMVKKLKTREGRLLLCDMNADVHKIFKLAGFTQIFNIFGTESESLKQFHPN